MKKFYPGLCTWLFIIVSVLPNLTSTAQTTLTTAIPTGLVYFSDTEPGVIVFGVRNNNSVPVTVTDLSSYVETGHTGTYTLWYHTTAITGAPSAITTANGWVQATPSGTVNATSTGVTPILSGLSITIPANTTYRFALQSPIHGPFYGTSGSTGNVFTAGNVSIFAQSNPASPTYAGPFPGPATLTPRSFYGSITFSPTSACTEPPTPGSAIASVTQACLGQNFSLDVSGNTIGTGQTYQWQSSTDNTNWTNLGTSSTSPVLTTSLTANTYYRAQLTCGTTTVATASVQVLYQGAPVSGTFTINSAVATGGTNFQTFADAINSMSCGVSGPVVFNVVAGSGPYNEAVTIPNISGVSATNTITFNGNGATISYNSTVTGARAAITLNGSRYVTINDFNISAATGTYGWGVFLTNAASRNTINGNTINTSTTNNTTGNHAGIVISASASDATNSGNNGNFNTISNNTIIGGYYGVILYGSTTDPNENNLVSGNTVKDVYAYSIYAYGQNGVIIRGNNISRPTRSSSFSGGAGVYVTTGTINALVEKNRVHNMFDAMQTSTATFYGIYVLADGAAGQENKVINNAIYRMGGNGPSYGIANNAGPYMQAYHNTVVIDDASATSGTAYGLYQTGTAAGIEFRNNIVSISRSGTGAKRAVYFATVGSTIISNNNVLWLNAASGTNNHLGQFGTTNYTTLNDWKTANSNAYDQQSVSVDPQFTDVATGNLLPGNATIATIGANLGVTTDIINVTRTTTPTPGAWEMSTGGCTSPPTPGTVSASPSTAVCPLTTVNLSVTGNSTGVGQTYQWQTSATSGGTYTNVGGVLTAPSFSIEPTSTAWYRLAVTCSGNTQYSAPVEVVVTAAFPAGTYTINSALPTTGTNFQSFAAAISALNCGIAGPVVFNVVAGSGPYTEQITIPQVGGTSAVNTVTFNGNGETIQAAPVTATRQIIRLDGADYIILKNLNIVSTATGYGWGVHLTNGANFNVIDGNTINVSAVTATTQSESAGVVISGSTTSVLTDGSASNNRISNNAIIGGYQGVIINGFTNSLNAVRDTIMNNTIHDFYANGIELTNTDSAYVFGNNIHRMNRVGVTTFAGVELGTGAINTVVMNNRIHDTHNAATTQSGLAYGVFVNGADAPVGSENRIINNLIYKFNSLTGTQYGLYNLGSDGAWFYHNTVVLNNATSTSGTTRGIFQSTGATNIQVRNNIVYVTRAGSGTKHALYYNTATSAIISNNNVLWVNTTGSTVGIGSFGTTNYATLADWQTANSGAYDAQSVSVDPQFLDPANGVFYPNNSAIGSIGEPVGVTTDILGNSRDQSPTPGAYEILASINADMGAKSLLLPVQKTCYSSTERVTVTIRNYSSSTHNFLVQPVTVMASVAGPNSQTFAPVIVNTGSLAPDDTLDVVVSNTYNMSAPGSYVFSAYTIVTGDASAANDTMQDKTIVVDPLSAGTVVANPSAFCISGGIPRLSLTGYSGGSIQWQQSTTATGPWTNVGTGADTYTAPAAITATMYYRAYVTCQANGDTSAVVPVSINNPQLLTSAGGTRCGPGTVIMTATAAPGNIINWYETATGGLPVGTGNIFTSPIINTNTTYYVAANEGMITSIVGVSPTETGCGALTSTTTTDEPLRFTTTKAVTINSAWVIPVASGTFTAALRATGSSTNIQTASFTFTTSQIGIPQQINLGFVIPAPGNYQLTNSAGGAYRFNTFTCTYPYNSVAGGFSIIGSATSSTTATTSTTAYRTFFDLSVSEVCETTRQPVVATLTTAPPLGLTESTNICSNTIKTLTVTTPLSNFDSYVWSPVSGLFTDAAATIPYTGGNASTVYAKIAPAGTYTYTLTANNSGSSCQNIDSVKLDVLPGNVTLTASPVQICVSGSTTLSILPETGYTGASFQWYSSPDGVTYTAIPAAVGGMYTTPSLTSRTWYRIDIADANGNVCQQPTVSINVNSPSVTATTPASLCNPGSMTLQATGSSGTTLNWYSAATGGTILGSGSSFATPVINSTTTYYVGAMSGATTGTGGKTAPATPVTGDLNNYGLQFTVDQHTVLNSVDVISVTGTSISIALYNGTGASFIQSANNITVQDSTQTTIPLGWSLAPGTYRLVATSMTGTFVRETSGTGYPLALSTAGTINGTFTTLTGTVSTAGSYNWFYNWNVSAGCESPRVAVTAAVNVATAITAQPSSQATCVGSTVTFQVNANGGSLTYQWRKNGTPISGATTNTLTINNTTTTDAANYDVVVTGTCGAVTSSVASLVVATTNSWLGSVSVDWSNPNNWCGGLPTPASDVVITANTPYSPSVNGLAEVRNLTINSGATVTVNAGGTLNLFGNFVNNGTFTAPNGLVIFKGSTNQTVGTMSAGTVLINGAGITLAGNMTIANSLILTNGNITLGTQNLVLNGSSSGTASSHVVTNGTGSVISNNITTGPVIIPVGPDATNYNPVIISNGQGRNYTVRVVVGINPGGMLNSARAINRTWNITPSSAVSTPVNMLLQYADAHAIAPAVPTIVMEAGVHNGTQWNVVSPASGITPSGTPNARQVGISTIQFGPTVIANIGGFTSPLATPNVDADITQVLLMPNLVQNRTVLRIQTRRSMKINWSVIDAQGRVVMQFQKPVMAGQTDLPLDFSVLAGGHYYLIGNSDKGKTRLLKFIKQ